ncbi:hypothetical protein V5N11_026606 [Cardamine amara subsp. amara]|uniref:Uncharacterized protein n=1 Tax=Cardamine amara subsp. amara TaxID=228776 RepID=A0ABD1ABC6_CARAN
MVRMCLDTGSNRNFLSAEAQAGWILVENLARSDSISNKEYGRGIQNVHAFEANGRSDIQILHEKVDMMLLKSQPPPAPVAPDGDIKLLLQQLIHSQDQAAIASTKQTLDLQQQNLDIKQQLSNLYTEQQSLRTLVHSTHTIPPATTPLPDQQISAITLRNGKQLPPREPISIPEDSEIQEGEGDYHEKTQAPVEPPLE